MTLKSTQQTLLKFETHKKTTTTDSLRQTDTLEGMEKRNHSIYCITKHGMRH